MPTSAVLVTFSLFVTAYCPHTRNLFLWCIYWIDTIDYVHFHRNQYHGGNMLTYPYMFMTFNHLQISIPSSSQEPSDRMNWGCCKHTHSASPCHIQWAHYWLNWRAMTAFSEGCSQEMASAVQNYCNEFHILILKQGKIWDMRARSLVLKLGSKR